MWKQENSVNFGRFWKFPFGISCSSIFVLLTILMIFYSQRWLRLCVRGEHEEMYQLAVKFVSQQGRMKYIRPLYR